MTTNTAADARARTASEYVAALGIVFPFRRMDMVQAFEAGATYAAAEQQRDMPTIWVDPAGKGYPCFERRMTPKECREAIEMYEKRILELERQRIPRSDGEVRAQALEEAAQICDVLADGYARTGPDQAEIGLRNAGTYIRERALIPIAPDGVARKRAIPPLLND
jgi:hypothetical protein